MLSPNRFISSAQTRPEAVSHSVSVPPDFPPNAAVRRKVEKEADAAFVLDHSEQKIYQMFTCTGFIIGLI
jgi:hypothetical protein